MSGFLATLGRELRAYFLSPVAYLILATFLLINGIIFFILVGFLNYSPSPPNAPLQYLFGGTLMFWLVLAFLGPVIPMRLISEERRSGTLEFLMTAAVTEYQVVLGKYLAATIFYAFLWLPTVTYALLIAHHEELDWGPIAASYLGVLAIGALFLAAGTLASALSRNQLVSAVIGFGLLFVLFAFGFLEFWFSDPGSREVFSYLNLVQHMDDFSQGIVDTRRLVYYATGVGLFLFLAGRALEALKWR